MICVEPVPRIGASRLVFKRTVSMGLGVSISLLIAWSAARALGRVETPPAVLLVVFVPALAALGQATLWQCVMSTTRCTMKNDRIEVRHRGQVVLDVRREDLVSAHVRGHFGWHELLTAHSVASFPRLVLRTDRETFESPPLLLWSTEAAVADVLVQDYLRRESG